MPAECSKIHLLITLRGELRPKSEILSLTSSQAMCIHTTGSFTVSASINTAADRSTSNGWCSQNYAGSVSCGWEDDEESASVSEHRGASGLSAQISGANCHSGDGRCHRSPSRVGRRRLYSAQRQD